MIARTLRRTALGLLACGAVSAAQAALVTGQGIGIDYDEAGNTAGSGPEVNFNVFTRAMTANSTVGAGSVIDTSGAVVSGVSIISENWSMGSGSMMHESIIGYGVAGNDYTGSPFSDLSFNDGTWNSPNSAGSPIGTITFAGLDDGLLYDLQVVGGLLTGSPDFRVNANGRGEAKFFSDIRNGSGPISPLVLTGLRTDGAGNLVVTVDHDVNYFGLNALYLEAGGEAPPLLTIAAGDVIKVDFSTAGDGDGGDMSDWNAWANAASITTPRRHGDGAIVSGVRITFGNFNPGKWNNEPRSGNWVGTASDPYYVLGADDIYYHMWAGAAYTTFSGLDDGLTYNVRVYSLISGEDSQVDTITVTDGAGTQFVQNTRGTRWYASSLEDGGTVFTDLVTDAAGNIVVEWNPITVSAGPLNAIILEANGDPELPMVRVTGATQVLGDTAWLECDLLSTGSAPTTVYACWGATDAGSSDILAWDQHADLGALPAGPVSHQVAGLTPDTEYFYRCAASNSYGIVWTRVASFTPSYPVLSVENIQLAEGDTGSSQALFPVRLSSPYPAPIALACVTSNGTALAGADYAAADTTATFDPGQTLIHLPVGVFGDIDSEPEEYFFLRVSAPSVTGSTLTATCVVLDDERTGYLSPSDLVADEVSGVLYVAQSTAGRVDVLDVDGRLPLGSIELPDDPSGLALSADGATLYATAGVSSGVVFVVDTATRLVTATIPVGHSPRAPVFAAADTLYVCNQFDHTVSIVALLTETETGQIPVLREPFAAAVTPDSTALLVCNLLPHGAATETNVAAGVSVISTATGMVTDHIALPPGSQSLRGITVSPDGRYAFVSHTLSRYRVPTTQITRGWINTSALSVLDLDTMSLLNTVLLDDLDLGAANPWGVACSADGQVVCVAHAGTHELSVIDWPALQAKLAGETGSVADDLTYLADVRRRLPLGGNGPRELAMIGPTAYAAQYFSETLAVADTAPGQEHRTREWFVAWPRPLDVVRQGESYFHDATLCVQHWHSCASCHPGVRTDALNWDLLNDGFGNPKNTKSLLHAHQTPPTTITGIRGNAEISVMAGLRFIHFVDYTDDTNAHLDEFLKAIQPVPSPALEDGELSPAALRGETLFTTAGCAYCHSGPYLTDQSLHDVGTGTGLEAGTRFDTPTLIESWRTGPYLYDGSAATLRDVLTTFNPSDQHGTTSGLSPQDLDDLEEFIKAL